MRMNVKIVMACMKLHNYFLAKREKEVRVLNEDRGGGNSLLYYQSLGLGDSLTPEDWGARSRADGRKRMEIARSISDAGLVRPPHSQWSRSARSY